MICPDFAPLNSPAAGETGEEEEDALTPDEAPAKDAVINEPTEVPAAPESSRANSEDGSVAPAAAPAAAPQPDKPPSLELLHKMEVKLRSLENSVGHLHPTVRFFHPLNVTCGPSGNFWTVKRLIFFVHHLWTGFGFDLSLGRYASASC